MPLVVYVDGFNLYNGIKSAYGRRFLWLDLVQLARRLRPRESMITVKYFTAAVLDEPGAASRQSTYLKALSAHCGEQIEIIMGRYQRKTMRCRNCGETWTSYEEKETDVNMAVHLAADVTAGHANSALIISADSDMCPAVRTAQQTAPGVNIVAAFPPRRQSAELRKLLPRSFTIGRGRLAQSQLPPAVPDPATGRHLRRPKKWS
ncbi:NYN domain-containing protein [Streptomyces sp. HNM0575]|uniref:NYN domain-containing protein n=1 Tax=Streptomyces sp. HNM0575 TaxID=2716338 RepID=UPI0019D31C3F|nr:NYN domain-containing protein [Streptomyces sp. HNM0575]